MVVVVVIIILACTLPLLYKHILKRMYRINAIVRHQVEPLTQKELVKTVITFCKMCQRTMSVLVYDLILLLGPTYTPQLDINH